MVGTVVVANIECSTFSVGISDKTVFAKTDSMSFCFVVATWMTVHCCITSCSCFCCSTLILAAVLFPTSISFVVPFFILTALVVVAVFDGDATVVGHVANVSGGADAHFFACFGANNSSWKVRVACFGFFVASVGAVSPDFVFKTAVQEAAVGVAFIEGDAVAVAVADEPVFAKTDRVGILVIAIAVGVAAVAVAFDGEPVVVAAVLFPALVAFLVPSLVGSALIVVAVVDWDAAVVGHVADKAFFADAVFFAYFGADCVFGQVGVAGVAFLFAFVSAFGPFFVFVAASVAVDAVEVAISLGDAFTSGIYCKACFTLTKRIADGGNVGEAVVFADVVRAGVVAAVVFLTLIATIVPDFVFPGAHLSGYAILFWDTSPVAIVSDVTDVADAHFFACLHAHCSFFSLRRVTSIEPFFAWITTVGPDFMIVRALRSRCIAFVGHDTFSGKVTNESTSTHAHGVPSGNMWSGVGSFGSIWTGRMALFA